MKTSKSKKDMEPQLIALLYSKYSPASSQILNAISSVPNNVIVRTCIDNADVRKRIESSKSIKVEVVPCVLACFPGGTVEKYDGPAAFSFVQSIVSSFQPRESYEPPRPKPPPQQPPHPTMSENPVPRNRRRARPPTKETSIEDLGFEENSDPQEESAYMGSEDLMSQMSDAAAIGRAVKGTRKKEEKGAPADIKYSVEEMQREREAADKQIFNKPRPGMIPPNQQQ